MDRLLRLIAALAVTLVTMTNLAHTAGKTLSIELNNAQPAESKCRVSFVASNGLSQVVDKAALEVVVFNAKSVISEILVLDFGRLPIAKTKVVQFDFANTCDNISRLLINDFTECSVDGAASSTCLDIIEISSRSQIVFGI